MLSTYNPLVAFWGQMITDGVALEEALAAFSRRRLARDLTAEQLALAALPALTADDGSTLRPLLLLQAAREARHLPAPARAEAMLQAAQCLARGGFDRWPQCYEALREALALLSPRQDPELFAEVAQALGNGLLDTGAVEAAEEALTQAESLYRRLAKTQPALYTAPLANTLTGLGLAREKRGDLPGMAAAFERGLAIYRRLARSEPREYEWELARALEEFGNALRRSGDKVTIRAVHEEALDLYRRLATRAPRRAAPGLARLLHGYGGVLGEFGDSAAACAAYEEALSLLRQAVAEGDPCAPGLLAITLSSLGAALGAVGAFAEARATLEEAIGLWRERVGDDREAFEGRLGTMLAQLARTWTEAGEPSAALPLYEEAVALLRGLAQQQPAVYTVPLADTLADLGAAQAACGDTDAAIAALDEAVVVCRSIAEDDPETFLASIRYTLARLADLLMETPARLRALGAGAEIGELSRRVSHGLLPSSLAAAEALLAGGVLLAQSGDLAGASRSLETCVAESRALAAANAGEHLPLLAAALNELGIVLREAGAPDDARAALEEALGMRRALAAEDPLRHLSELATTLYSLAMACEWQDDLADAVEYSVEAGDLYRLLAADDPETYRPRLALQLRDTGRLHHRMGHHAASRAGLEEAVAIQRSLGDSDDGRDELVRMLLFLALALQAAGEADEARVACDEALALERALEAKAPCARGLGPLLALNEAARVRAGAGLAAEARDLHREAAERARELVLHYEAAGDEEAKGRAQEALAALEQALSAHEA